MTFLKNYPLQKNPSEWYQAVLKRPKSQVVNVDWNKTNRRPLNQALLKQQSKNWFGETGFRAEESKFAIIIPIHNEANFLPSFLATLSFAKLPSQAHIYFIFVTNCCNDGSEKIIEDLIRYVGNVDSDKEFLKAQFINNQFIYKNIQKAGKAVAINEGLAIATEFNLPISMVIDANNFIDEHSVPEIFKSAKRYFHPGSAVVYISGVKRGIYKKSFTGGFVKRIREFKKNKIHEHRSVAVGAWLMCLDTEWVNKIGEVPSTTVEDLALGLLAHQDGKKTLKIPSAYIWGYHSSTIRDKFKEEIRFIKGKLQILRISDDYDTTISLLQKDTYYMRGLKGRLMFYWNNLQEDPFNLFFYVFCFIFWESALLAAKSEYKHDPSGISWSSIASTKD